MNWIKSYFKAVKEVAVDTWDGVLNADEKEITCVCLSILTFGVLGIFITYQLALAFAGTIIGLAYANYSKTK